MSRTFGWVQDSGSFENLKRILLAMLPFSSLNRQLRENLIPRFVPVRYRRDDLIAAITGENCSCISYELLKGCGSVNQLTAEENTEMFGYTSEEARLLAAAGGRGNAACTGIAQIAVPAQKLLPNGQNKPYQGDWQAECFLRWGVSLGFIDYDSETDSCRVSDIGRQFAEAETDSDEEKNIIGEAMMSYPPAYRVLQLLAEQGRLTKFEIGRQLGFIGEAGFTSVSQALYVGGISTASNQTEKQEIRQNFEGSSDKYARMIAGWLCKIGWVTKVAKTVTENYAGTFHTAVIGQSYEITQRGQVHLNRIRGTSRHRRAVKRVFWNMLATAAPDADYLRNRRYYILQAIESTSKNAAQIQEYLRQYQLEVSEAAINDDIGNFQAIGLSVDCSSGKYILRDTISCLSLPADAANTTHQTDLSAVKDRVREQLHNINHRYLDLIDLSYNNRLNREFEIETMSLLTEELGYCGLHLGGARRPDGLFYQDTNGVIVDTKAYSEGYNLPITQADEMIRYIDENKNRGNLNPNLWWNHFHEAVVSFSFLFVSSEFKGHFQENLQYIKDRTDYNGSVITAKNLLLLAEKVQSGAVNHEEMFRLIRCNREVSIEM